MKNALAVAALFIWIFSSNAFAAFSLCLGAYSKEEAEGLHKQLVTQGYPVYLSYGENYEVRVAHLKARKRLMNLRKRLKSATKLTHA